MAKETLPFDFKDDILDPSMNGKRRFNMMHNDDGTVSFEDVTDYSQIGSDFGQKQINQTNQAVNESADKNRIIDDLTDIAANTQAGMMAGALAVRELNSKTYDTGWVDCDLGTNISIDDPNNGKPKVRRIGNMIILSGTAKTDTTWSEHDAIITIPDGFRTTKFERFVCVASGQYSHRLDVLPSGVCKSIILEGKKIPAKVWLQFEGFWFVD